MIYRNLNHKNLVKLLGVSLDGNPIYIVTEFCGKVSDWVQRLNLCVQIANNKLRSEQFQLTVNIAGNQCNLNHQCGCTMDSGKCSIQWHVQMLWPPLSNQLKNEQVTGELHSFLQLCWVSRFVGKLLYVYVFLKFLGLFMINIGDHPLFSINVLIG